MKTDERVRFMDEIISGVQLIKMYTWEKPFSNLINYARKLELTALSKTAYIRGFHMTFLLLTTRMALFCTMVAIILTYGPQRVTSAQIFVITSYFQFLAHMMSQRFTRGVSECAEVLVALRRLENFLSLGERETLADEKKQRCTNNGIANNSLNSIERLYSIEKEEAGILKHSVVMVNVTARWEMPASDKSLKKKCKKNESNGPTQNGGKKDSKANITDLNEKVLAANEIVRQTPTLDGLSAQFLKGQLIGVVGPVGAGKSSLLQTLLHELPLVSGSISIDGSISYASQEPWLFAASVRQNIVFGEDYDHDRYNRVVRICALTTDFEQLEHGDQTIVGERGASLSGGQKSRIK